MPVVEEVEGEEAVLIEEEVMGSSNIITVVRCTSLITDRLVGHASQMMCKQGQVEIEVGRERSLVNRLGSFLAF